MTDLIRVPKTFFDDHEARDLDTPEVARTTKHHYLIRSDDPAIPELLNDAEYYADAYGPDMSIGFKASARATAKALRSIPNIATMITAYDHDGTRRR